MSKDGDDRGSAPDRSVSDFPVKDWERYRFVAFLGGGGMGRVFKAFDPRLDRHVALKFLHGKDPRLVQRFKQEARAQANIEHERVCKVYEVGEVEGHPYIAMQLIDGLPLREAARGMTLEQKLLVIREVAFGLHAAHRAGLIHRDVKPGNLLVERGESGGYRPYVMDFGLARLSESSGLTMTGVALGTPYYMPPEQARGEAADRRSDVYGLGATLYEILTGRPPFQGTSPAAVLMKVLREVPDPPRRSNPAIPQDVEAITMRCLRHDPHERYASARALAEDIQSYLDGEPVAARPTGLLYRLRMRARKHKFAVALGSAATLLLVCALLWGGYAQWNAARRARLAQTFGQQVERIEAIARYAFTIPLHDTRPERGMIRERMSRIEEQIRRVGRTAVGPGHYALGRGHLALGDYEAALSHLETAWESGYQEPETAYALGRVLGEIYTIALREAEQAADAHEREAHKSEVARTYRRPALEFLQRGRSVETESPEFVEALLAYYEERYDEALDRARQAYERLPWMYEARKLEGDVLTAMAEESGERGDYDAATVYFERAGDSYRAAMAVGESDPGVYASMCGLQRVRMVVALRGRGEEVAPFFREGIEACDAALRADPGNGEALIAKSGLYARMSEHERNRGQDPRESLRRSIEAAEQAVAGGLNRERAHSLIGVANQRLANYRMDRGEDPREALDAAIAAYERALTINPRSFSALNELGVVYKSKAGYSENRGEDPSEGLEQAVAAYERALAIKPDYLPAHANLGVALYKLAGHRDDPLMALDKAIRALERALEINPNQMIVMYQLGRIYDDQAVYRVERGEDPRESLRAAADAYRRAIDINPESVYRAHVYNGLGRALHQLGIHERDTGGDPRADFDGAIEAYGESIRANPNLVFAYGNLGALYADVAEHRLNVGGDPRAELSAAVENCRKAIEIKPDYALALTDLVEAYRVRARFEVDNGRDPAESVRGGSAALAAALKINPNLETGRASLVRLRVLDLRFGSARGDSREVEAGETRSLLEEALAREPGAPATLLAGAEFFLWCAESGAGETIAQALEMTDEALSKGAMRAEVLGLRGELLILKAERERDDGERAELLRQARQAFEEALSNNRNLADRFEPRLARIERLSE